VAAAIQIPTGKWPTAKHEGRQVYPDLLTVTAPPPARHHTLMHPMSDHGIRVPPERQGFLTSSGRFVGREEALNIAKLAGQPMIDHSSRHDTLLFSEDLW